METPRCARRLSIGAVTPMVAENLHCLDARCQEPTSDTAGPNVSGRANQRIAPCAFLNELRDERLDLFVRRALTRLAVAP
jgi:hypothetical protein